MLRFDGSSDILVTTALAEALKPGIITCLGQGTVAEDLLDCSLQTPFGFAILVYASHSDCILFPSLSGEEAGWLFSWEVLQRTMTSQSMHQRLVLLNIGMVEFYHWKEAQ